MNSPTQKRLPIEPDTVDIDRFVARGRATVETELAGLAELRDSLGQEFAQAAVVLLSLQGRVIVSGLGKSGQVAAKVASTLASTGTPAIFLHAAEAAHGDLGIISAHDVLILFSNSGETAELVPILQHAARLSLCVIGISSKEGSLLLRESRIPLLLPPAEEACPVGVAPTTSTAMMMALGDALAMVVMEQRGFSRDDFRALHPGGRLGLRLMRVSEIMHRGEKLPLVTPETRMDDVIMTITSKSFGLAGVADADGLLVGVITDGDLRRHLGELTLSTTAADIMSHAPRVIPASMLAEDALKFLNEQKVTALFVVEEEGDTRFHKPLGLVHVHDFLRLGLEQAENLP